MKGAVAIIGCGPAGAACAVHLARSGVDTIVFEENEIGGTIRFAHLVENYPGFPGGVTGDRLASLIRDSFLTWYIPVIPERVTLIHENGDSFRIETGETTDEFPEVVVATGTRPKKLSGVKVEHEALGRIFYDVRKLKAENYRKVGILGAGDVALDYALHLSPNSEVHVFHRSEKPRCIPLLLDRALAKGVVFHPTSGLRFVSKLDDGIRLDLGAEEFTVDALLPAIGREPVLDFLSPEILPGEDHILRHRGLHFIGDVHNGPFRQVAIAAGDGLRVAMEVFRKWR